MLNYAGGKNSIPLKTDFSPKAYRISQYMYHVSPVPKYVLQDLCFFSV